ncbi:hypothetical protein GW17_00054469 [Ensete ventricosum]|nr:hypothetical protein GW17_00054469 [Ensete ventricosum]RZS08306.1 hypothetical protein BHM03_00039281 [Ensete ventricosum]
MWQELIGSSPIGGRKLTGNSPEVVGSLPIGDRELAGNSSEFVGSSPTGNQELTEGSPEGCLEFVERSINVSDNEDYVL